MTAHGRFRRWIISLVLFLLAALLQIALVGFIVADRARILRNGTEVMLRTHAVDPRDLLRGDYVALNYDISSVAAGELKDQPVTMRRSPVYVKLSPGDDGFYEAVAVSQAPLPVNGKEVLIRGRVSGGDGCGTPPSVFCDTLQVSYGLESYFVPQGEGQQIGNARNANKLAIVAAVTANGRAAIKRLLIDGKPAYEEPWF
jgi:uncharacterized membrane-anchored protein